MMSLLRGMVLLSALLMAAGGARSAELEVTPSRVFAEALYVERQLEVIGRHLGTGVEDETIRPVRARLKPRHAMQKSYEILYKINRVREQHGLPVISVGALEPRLEVEPRLTFEQLRRIRTELELLFTRLGVEASIPPVEVVEGKTPADVYNKLRELSAHLDRIAADELIPSQVFGEAMRLYHDINAILSHLRIHDETIPPEKFVDATPGDVFRLGFGLLDEVQRLQRTANIERTDFSEFNVEARATPSQVFELIQLIIAELQSIKAHLGMRYDLTPPARHYRGKQPAEVLQVLGWCRRKLWLIDNDNFNR